MNRITCTIITKARKTSEVHVTAANKRVKVHFNLDLQGAYHEYPSTVSNLYFQVG